MASDSWSCHTTRVYLPTRSRSKASAYFYQKTIECVLGRFGVGRGEASLWTLLPTGGRMNCRVGSEKTQGTEVPKGENRQGCGVASCLLIASYA